MLSTLLTSTTTTTTTKRVILLLSIHAREETIYCFWRYAHRRADTWNTRQKCRSGPLVSDWQAVWLMRHESEKGRYGAVPCDPVA